MQQRSEETRQHILSAAMRVFAQCGYDGSGVAEICAEAGVSKGAFYHHFHSKHGVFLALLHDWLDGLEGRLRDTFREAEDTPHALIAMTRQIPAIFADAQGRLPIFLEFWMQASRDPVFGEAAAEPFRHYLNFFRELVLAGQAEGALNPQADAETAGRVIMALAVGVLFQGLMDAGGADWEKVTSDGMRYLLAGLQAPG